MSKKKNRALRATEAFHVATKKIYPDAFVNELMRTAKQTQTHESHDEPRRQIDTQSRCQFRLIVAICGGNTE